MDLLKSSAEIQPRNLTIREQARIAENPNENRWPAIAPAKPTDSILISELTKVEARPTGGRRGWNAEGREIGEETGDLRSYEMVPVTFTHHFDERRMQRLRETNGHVAELVAAKLIRGISEWATYLADAVDRQFEVDLFESWFTGTLTVFDPKSDANEQVALEFDADRYVNEPTPWTDPTVDVWDRLLRQIEIAAKRIGSVGAIRTRSSVIARLITGAPASRMGDLGIRPTLANVEARLGEEGFGPIKLVSDERDYDAPVNGGRGKVKRNYVPAGKMGFMPRDGRVGNTHFAPVTRAEAFMGNAAAVKTVNLQNVVVFHRSTDGGKTTLVEAEALGVPMPENGRVYVVQTGIGA